MIDVQENLNKILYGDSREVLKLFPDNSVDYTLTSPPYNNKTNVIKNKRKGMYQYYKDNLLDTDYFLFLKEIISELLRVTKKYTFFNIMYNVDNKEVLCKLIGYYAENIKDILIWEKPKQPAMCTYILTHNFEFVFIFSKGKENRKYDIDFGKEGNYTTCFKEINNAIYNKERFSCKENLAIMSVQLARRLISTFTRKKDIILDPFMGTGTTAVAAKQLNRNFIGIENDREIISIARERIDKTSENILKGNNDDR